jgi:hypothetical protein
MMNEAGTTDTSTAAAASPAVTLFDLRIHFQGAYVFSFQTDNSSSHPGAKLTGVEVFTPACEHTNAATINTGSTYMLESYWHCIDPVYGDPHTANPITLGQLQKNIAANTPWAVNSRPMGAAWDIAYKLPVAPDDWQCATLASATGPAGSCFSGNDAKLIPAVVALEHILTYKQISSVKFHGACFATDFTPVNGVTNLYLTSEVPYIPTRQHERRAADAIAALLGLDLVLDYSIGAATQAAGIFQPKFHTGNCMMSIVTGPIPV